MAEKKSEHMKKGPTVNAHDNHQKGPHHAHHGHYEGKNEIKHLASYMPKLGPVAGCSDKSKKMGSK